MAASFRPRILKVDRIGMVDEVADFAGREKEYSMVSDPIRGAVPVNDTVRREVEVEVEKVSVRDGKQSSLRWREELSTI